jgi:hypothetical protein
VVHNGSKLETKSCFGYECISLSATIHLHLCQ